MYEHCERIFGAKFDCEEIYRDGSYLVFTGCPEPIVIPKEAGVKIELMGEHLSEVRDD